MRAACNLHRDEVLLLNRRRKLQIENLKVISLHMCINSSDNQRSNRQSGTKQGEMKLNSLCGPLAYPGNYNAVL